MAPNDGLDKVDIDGLKTELGSSEEYPLEVIVDVREYLDFEWTGGVRKAFEAYEPVEETLATEVASRIAAPHLFVKDHVQGFDGADEPKRPSRTLSEGGVCYNQAIALLSLYGTLSIPARKLKVARPRKAHSTVLVGLGSLPGDLTEPELLAGLSRFYEVHDVPAPDPSALVQEPDSARHLSDDVRDEFSWYVADPVFSRYVGNSMELTRLGYIERNADFWRRSREAYETIVLSEEDVYMLGEEGIERLHEDMVEVSERDNEAVDTLRDAERNHERTFDEFEGLVEQLRTNPDEEEVSRILDSQEFEELERSIDEYLED